ncbi:MAG: 4,5-DOPA dioxygenase extradiol [Proteobacteria bacterium]|nr:4,5-DOPA dioxygenase extradiol [Pseudomonadota bacterium]
MNTTRMPALFIGHGSPMNAIEDNAFTRGWQELASRMPEPKAILCVSAHWESRGSFVCAASQPRTIHDFRGFPQSLFDVRYPAPGDPVLARRVADLVKSTSVHTTSEWGLDHGAWSVLNILYPQADVPTLQLSIDSARPGAFHHALGRELGTLRDEGVLILGSGNIVHNLRTLNFHDPRPTDWAVRFDDAVRDRIAAGRVHDLLDWRALDRDAALAVPTPEHYLPLLYVLGAQRDDDTTSFHNVDYVSTISMTSVLLS